MLREARVAFVSLSVISCIYTMHLAPSFSSQEKSLAGALRTASERGAYNGHQKVLGCLKLRVLEVATYFPTCVHLTMYNAQKSHANLKHKVSKQSQDLDRLLHMTSTDISSASASELPSPSHSFTLPRGSIRGSETSPMTTRSPPCRMDRKEEIRVSYSFKFFVVLIRIFAGS